MSLLISKLDGVIYVYVYNMPSLVGFYNSFVSLCMIIRFGYHIWWCRSCLPNPTSGVLVMATWGASRWFSDWVPWSWIRHLGYHICWITWENGILGRIEKTYTILHKDLYYSTCHHYRANYNSSYTNKRFVKWLI